MKDTAENGSRAERIHLTFPAHGDLVVLARLVVAAVAARTGFDLDEVEDLRLAVSEICLLSMGGGASSGMPEALAGAEKRGELGLEITTVDGTISVSCVCDLGDEVPEQPAPRPTTLSEQLLEALVDKTTVSMENGCVRASFCKSRAGHAE
jgi:hypothetical protein